MVTNIDKRMASTNSIQLMLDYLSFHEAELHNNCSAVTAFEIFINELLECHTNNSQNLISILKSHGWSDSGFFTGTLCVELLLRSLAQSEESLESISSTHCAPFVPKLLKSSISQHHKDISALLCVYSTATILFVDVGGIDELFGESAKCFDEIHKLLKDVLCQVTQTILKFGGDVISFEGFSISCIFRDSDEDLRSKHSSSIRALACCVVLQQHALSVSAVCLHLSLGYGVINLSIVGGRNDVWNFVVHGQCLSELLTGKDDVAHNRLVASRRFCENFARCASINDGKSNVAWSTNPVVDIAPLSSSFDKILHTTATGNLNFYVIESVLIPFFDPAEYEIINANDNNDSEEAVSELLMFVPATVQAAMQTRQLSPIWELRIVMTLCAVVECSTDESPQELYHHVQQTLSFYGGYLKTFVQYRVGWRVVVQWGVPQCSYDDNSNRSLYCALSLRNQCSNMQWKCSIGITMGSATCGLCGTVERQGYVIIGQTVCLAEQLASPSTAQAAGALVLSKLAHDQLSPRFQTMFQVAATASQRSDCGRATIDSLYLLQSNAVIPPDPILRRPDIQLTECLLPRNLSAALMEQLNMLDDDISEVLNGPSMHFAFNRLSSSSGKSGHTTIVEEAIQLGIEPVFTVILGSAGTGKTTAVQFVLHEATKKSFYCVYVMCRSGEQANPFGLIARIFMEIVGEKNFDTEAKQRYLIGKILTELGHSDGENSGEIRTKRFGALAAFLSLSWQETPEKTTVQHSETKQLILGPVLTSMTMYRHGKTFAEVLRILLRGKKTVLIIDDSHYCDELSWKQLYQVLTEPTRPLAVFFSSKIGNRGTDFGSLATLSKHVYHSRKLSTKQSNLMSTLVNRVQDLQHSNDIVRSFASSFASSVASSRSSTCSQVAATCAISDVHDDIFGRNGFQRNVDSAYLKLLKHPACRVLELSFLTESDVKDMLTRLLDEAVLISEDLVASVHNFTSGNPFWCNSVVDFIKKHGVASFNRAISKSDNMQVTLGALVISKLDLLVGTAQLVGKYASVVGDQFNLEILRAVCPPEIVDVWENLEILRANNFITLIDESSSTFTFQNSLIRTTLYGFLPNDLLQSIHLATAHAMLARGSKEYHLLSYHFRKAGHRTNAYKQTMNSAKRAIRHSAYSEGFAFLQTALPLAVSRPELADMIGVANQAMALLNPPARISKMLAKMMSLEGATENAKLYAQFSQLTTDLEATSKLLYPTDGTSTVEDTVDGLSNKAAHLAEVKIAEKKAAVVSNTRFCVIS